MDISLGKEGVNLARKTQTCSWPASAAPKTMLAVVLCESCVITCSYSNHTYRLLIYMMQTVQGKYIYRRRDTSLSFRQDSWTQLDLS